MKPLKTLLVTGCLLVAFSALGLAREIDRESPAEWWLGHYYEYPRPDEFVKNVHRLSRLGYFERDTQPATAIGFFATLFAGNPDRVESWLKLTADLPDKHRRILAAAAWQSGHPRGGELLRAMSANASYALRGFIADLLVRGPFPLAGAPVRSESAMNLQWGAFLASGDERHILSVLAALGSDVPELGTAARYSLAQNAAEHPVVLEVCRTQLSRQPASVQEELRAALNEAAGARQPGA